MGAKKIAVVDLSQAEDTVKTSRKRAKNLKDVASAQATEKLETEQNLEVSPKDQVETVTPQDASTKAKKTNVIKPESKEQKHSHRYTELLAKVDKTKSYQIDEALKLLKELANTKFVGAVELHLLLNQNNIRGFLTLPHPIKLKKNVLVFGDVKAQDGVNVGDEATIKQIEEGKLAPGRDFQLVIATPAFMPKLAKVAKILGPKGVMPSPKSGTVTEKPEAVLSEFLGGKIEYRSEEHAPLVHLKIGTTNIDAKYLEENLLAIIDSIGRNKISKMTLNATMSPSIRVAL